MRPRPLSLRAIGLTFVVGLAVAFAFGGSPDWHKHVAEGMELLHAHSHLGAHQHPHRPAVPNEEGEGGRPGDDAEESADYVGLSTSGGEAIGTASPVPAACGISSSEAPAAEIVARRPWHGPTESRGPPSRAA